MVVNINPQSLPCSFLRLGTEDLLINPKRNFF